MFLRRLFGKSKVLVTKEKAIQIAKSECEQRNWSWREPVKATMRFGNWEVRTNTQARGASARIIIDKYTGEVKKAGYLKR